jgi:hypothetical protein
MYPGNLVTGLVGASSAPDRPAEDSGGRDTIQAARNAYKNAEHNYFRHGEPYAAARDGFGTATALSGPCYDSVSTEVASHGRPPRRRVCLNDAAAVPMLMDRGYTHTARRRGSLSTHADEVLYVPYAWQASLFGFDPGLGCARPTGQAFADVSSSSSSGAAGGTLDPDAGGTEGRTGSTDTDTVTVAFVCDAAADWGAPPHLLPAVARVVDGRGRTHQLWLLASAQACRYDDLGEGVPTARRMALLNPSLCHHSADPRPPDVSADSSVPSSPFASALMDGLPRSEGVEPVAWQHVVAAAAAVVPCSSGAASSCVRLAALSTAEQTATHTLHVWHWDPLHSQPAHSSSSFHAGPGGSGSGWRHAGSVQLPAAEGAALSGVSIGWPLAAFTPTADLIVAVVPGPGGSSANKQFDAQLYGVIVLPTTLQGESLSPVLDNPNADIEATHRLYLHASGANLSLTTRPQPAGRKLSQHCVVVAVSSSQQTQRPASLYQSAQCVRPGKESRQMSAAEHQRQPFRLRAVDEHGNTIAEMASAERNTDAGTYTFGFRTSGNDYDPASGARRATSTLLTSRYIILDTYYDGNANMNGEPGVSATYSNIALSEVQVPSLSPMYSSSSV